MKKLILLPVMVLCCFLACVKDNKGDLGDLGGSLTLNGTLRLYDTLTGGFSTTGVGPIPVYLKYTSDNTGFLSSTVSKAGGQYSFTGIDPAKAYTVYALLDSNKLHYTGKKDYRADTLKNRQSDTLVLSPSQDNQIGIFYHLLDTTGAAFPGGALYIFSSKQARDDKDTAHYNWRLVTDNFGRALQMNLDPGPYYTYATGVYKNVVLEGTDDFTAKTAGIGSNVLKMTRAKGSGLQVYLVDGSQNPVANVNVYLYNNAGLWNNPDDSTGVGSIVSPPLKSDANGKCAPVSLSKGNYFIRAFARFGAISVHGSASFPVGGDSTTVVRVGVVVTMP